jgi:hypothetical protein
MAATDHNPVLSPKPGSNYVAEAFVNLDGFAIFHAEAVKPVLTFL